jgi:dynein heavy chain
MMTSKFVGYFLEQVSEWQKLLSTTDSVIVIWFEVQRTWSHLESIFIGSEDIRAQLPEHSKQFDKIDTDFKVYNMYTIQMVGSLPCVLLLWEEGNKVL